MRQAAVAERVLDRAVLDRYPQNHARQYRAVRLPQRPVVHVRQRVPKLGGHPEQPMGLSRGHHLHTVCSQHGTYAVSVQEAGRVRLAWIPRGREGQQAPRGAHAVSHVHADTAAHQ
ncbi:hypothetical protein HRbin32_01330 [bacterium HR32]|nr:hypothetical protein HRbin32_01330 [bacterium HR32]